MKDVMMIDTIKLHFTERRYFQELFPSRFERIPVRRGFTKRVSNPTKEELRKGIYGPKLTIMERPDKITLTVEFSAPKLLFGNNTDEVNETELDEMVRLLALACRRQGIEIPPHRFYDAKVLSFHPSKNIVLTDGYTSSLVLRHLSKVGVPKWLDVGKVKYQNGGHSLQFYSATNALAMYDKVAESKVPKRKKMDLDKDFKQQLSIFDNKGPKEIFRVEVRLNKTIFIKNVFQTTGFVGELTLRNVFQKKLCQDILLLYWDNFFGQDAILLDSPKENIQTWAEKIMIINPRLTYKQLQRILGILSACADEDGVRGYRQIMEASFPKWQWSKEKKLIEQYHYHLRSISVMAFTKQIEKQLTSFEPFRINSS